MKKINVIGGPGSGKSSLSRRIADALNLEYIELDRYNFKNNWKVVELVEFRQTVKQKMDSSTKGWVVDGGYQTRLGDMVRKEVDTVVFLQIPLFVAIPRVIRRSAKRIIHKEKLWGHSSESPLNSTKLLIWTINSHRKRTRSMREFEATAKDSGIDFFRFRTNGAANRWLDGTSNKDS